MVDIRSWHPVSLPVLVFVIWRITHAAIVLVFGGGLGETTLAFDAGYYVSVLRDGYTVPAGGYSEFSNVAFFPGLPWLTAVVLAVVQVEAVAIAIVANALALACFIGVWGAVRAWTGDDRMALRATIALALFPTSYYLWMYYSEALLIATTAAAAWCARTDRHRGTAAVLVLAATSRVVGVLVGPVLAAVRVFRIRRIDRISVFYVAASLIGFAAVLARQAIEIGDPLGWTKAQAAWGRELAPPWSPLITAVKDITGKFPVIAEGVALDLVTVVAGGVLVALLFLGARRNKWPFDPAMLAAASWFVPLCSRLVSSQIRFALVYWPVLLIPVAAWPRLHFALRAGLVIAAAGLTVVLLRRLALGMFTA